MRQLLSKRDAANRLGFHPEHLMRLVRRGEFPRPVRLSTVPNAHVRFLADEVDAWLEGRLAAREAAPADA
jgi:predicted DNA-binding transcriptional regulator AlpA